MENNKITKEILDKIPQNILYSNKSRKQIKQFHKELKKLISEKSKRNENLINIKKDIQFLITNIFPDKYKYFFYENNTQSLEIFIFCLCNQLEVQISKMVEGYKSFDFSLNDPDLNLIMDSQNKNKDIIPSFFISFYDFFEDELVINNEDVINTVIETNTIIEDNNNMNNNKKEEINNSFLLSILKIINQINKLSIADDEFKNIFIDGMKGNYSNLYDMGFLLIKIIESIIKIDSLCVLSNNKNNINMNIDKNLCKFIKISYNNIIPCLSEFFVKVILNYHLKSTLNIILKKEEFITLFTKLSSIRIIREKLLHILTIIKDILKPEQENYCKKIISKKNIFDKIIKNIKNDINSKKDYSTSEILSEIKYIIIYSSNNNLTSTKLDENMSLLFNNILEKNLKKDKNCINAFNSFFEEINKYNNNMNDENKYKLFNLMISLFQSAPLLSRSIVKMLLDNFKDNLEFYQEMIGKTNFFNTLVRNLYKCEGETINYFFEFLLNLYKNFDYFPNMELTNLINSITFFTDVNNLKIFVENLKKFNTTINQKKRKYITSFSNSNTNNTSKSSRKKSNISDYNSQQIIMESADLFEEINQNFIDIVLNIINDIITQTQNKTNENLFKAELLYPLFDYIQEIIKSETIYQYFSTKNFISLFHSLVCVPNYKGIAYKIIEVLLKSSKDKEHNEATIKLILNRYLSLSTNEIKEKDEKKIYFIEMNKFRELLFMYRTLKTTFIMETLSNNSKSSSMNEKIVGFVLKYLDHVNNNKKYIYKVYNNQFHLFFKGYIDYLFELLVISNENVINKQNIMTPKLNYDNLNKIIYKTILFFKGLNEYDKKNNTNVNVNKASSGEINKNSIPNNLININKSTNESLETKLNNNMYKTYNINNKNGNNINKSIITSVSNKFPGGSGRNSLNNDMNKIDYLFDIIKFLIDKSLNIKSIKENILYKKFDEYYINKYKINKGIFSGEKNKNILSNFILQSPVIIILLLNNLYKLDIYLDIFLDFIYLLCLTNENNTVYLLRQNILKILLEIPTNSIKYNYIILKILNCCFKFLTKEELKQVFEYLIKMFNNNNHSFTKDIIKSLNNTITTITSSDFDYSKGIVLSNYAIKQPNTYNIININNINLVCSNDSNIIIKQEVYFYTEINTDSKLVLLKLENEFFGGNKNKQFLEIALLNYNLSVNEIDSKLETNPDNKEANIVLNAKDFINLNDVNIFNYTFNRSEKILSVSVNGKNMYSYEYLFNFPNIESKKGNKYNINNSSIFLTIGYPLENIKEIDDKKFFIFPHIKLLSLFIKIENASKEKTTIYKMKIDKIKLVDKTYDNLTNFKLDDDTILISKYNSYDSIKINSIYYDNNINIILYNNIFFINTYLSHSFDYTFRLEKYLFILLNSLNLDKDLFKLLMNLLCSYFMINRKYLPKFLAKEEIISSLYFILYKNASFLDKSIIEIALPSLLTYDKLNSTIATGILLDYQVFQKLNNEAKKELLALIDRKLLIDDYNLDILLFEKLSNLLILCCNDTTKNNANNMDDNVKSVDELIIEIICKLIFKNSKTPSFIDKVKEIFYILFNFHTFVKDHIKTFNKGRPKDTYQIISSFFKKMFINDYILKIRNIFIKIINTKINIDKFVKNKLLDLCNTYNIKDNNYFNYKEGENNNDLKKQDFLDDYENISVNESKKYKNVDNRKKSYQIFKKDENHDDEIGGGILRKSKKKRTITEDNFIMKGFIGGKNDSFTITGKVHCINVKIILVNNEEINCNGDCQLCIFIKNLIKDLFLREIKFNIFEKYMLSNYSDTYIFNNNLDYNLNFSYYLMKAEGISRIRKNFQLRVDKITNIEIDRSTNEEKQKARKNELQKLFQFYKRRKISENLCDLFNLSQIFEIELITHCIDDTDKFQNCYNCLLFEGLNYINSVLILGREKIYLLTYVNISNDFVLYSSINPIPRTFWVVDNYNNILLDQCKYLQMFDHINEINKKSSKNINNEEKQKNNSDIFEKAEKGFQFYSFYYNEINEIHKKRFLHQNNAVEIFLKNGKNYYLAFNVDLRDIIVGKIIQNLIEAHNLRNRNLYINNNNELTNNNVSNGSLSNTDITSNSNSNSNNNGYSFEINNNNSSTVKNENMIFIRNINLFIEKEKNKVQKHKNIKSKGKKAFCKITDTKEILEQALEKWSNGFLNTYSYLMILNTLSGRTYNNLAQYPIYPWILKDYSSTEIDLNEAETYRDLSYPIYAQDEETRANLTLKYESFEENEIKYHCGSHYSNCGFVCYYLIRVKPFSNIAAEIQGNCFDTPDRLFFNIQKFYVVQEKYQELVPDVFNLPELYININNYVYGKTTDNFQVLDVVLPPWAMNSPRLFSKMNKKALESQFVSQHINDWIDLIFGYKRSGSEAKKSFNVLKDIFSNFDPKKDEEDMVEAKINELCEMGIDPIQLFTKSHPKREKHQIMKAFFGRSVFLTYFEARQSDNYQIKNFHSSSKIKEIRSYYEKNNGILSHGEGGLSSFRMTYENDTTFLKGKTNDNKETNIYFIVGGNKILLPPSYKNFIEWGIKNIFSIVKPFKNIKYSFKIKHMQNYSITCIKISSDGKYIVLGYDNGTIEKYRLKKLSNCYIEEVITIFQKQDSNNISNPGNIVQDNDNKKNPKNKKNSSKGKKILKNLFGFKKSNSKKYDVDERFNNISSSSFHNNPQFGDKNTLNNLSNYNNNNNNDSNQIKMVRKNHVIFNIQLSMSSSNILNSECILLNNKNGKFIQYNSTPTEINQNSNNKENIEGYYFHCKNASELKHLSKQSSSNNDNSQKGYVIFLSNSSYNILSEISLIDICDSYSFMLVVDKMNRIYLYNFHSFQLLNYINLSPIFTNNIKFSNICPYTGDFIVSSSKNVVLMNINGVFLSQMSNFESKINSCFISVIPMTASDLFLFTGHKDGYLIISKLINNYSNNSKTNKFYPTDKEDKIIQTKQFYQEAFSNNETNYRKYLDNTNLSLVFDIVSKIVCSKNPLRFIKLTEDLTEIICIDNKNNLIYITYEKYFVNRKENKHKKNLKICPMCKSAIGSSKIVCHLCGKKLCENCKNEKILPEYSFKNPKAICEDCLQLINSTNKLLYDF